MELRKAAGELVYYSRTNSIGMQTDYIFRMESYYVKRRIEAGTIVVYPSKTNTCIYRKCINDDWTPWEAMKDTPFLFTNVPEAFDLVTDPELILEYNILSLVE